MKSVNRIEKLCRHRNVSGRADSASEKPNSERETEELRREVVLLRQDLALSRRVVTTSQATAFFDEYVKPGSLVGYIKYQGLPARKTGCLWHLYVQDIFDWQIGLIGHASTKKQGISNIVAPRHRHNAFVRMAAEQARLPQ